jgi:hypothetical protein
MQPASQDWECARVKGRSLDASGEASRRVDASARIPDGAYRLREKWRGSRVLTDNKSETLEVERRGR